METLQPSSWCGSCHWSWLLGDANGLGALRTGRRTTCWGTWTRGRCTGLWSVRRCSSRVWRGWRARASSPRAAWAFRRGSLWARCWQLARLWGWLPEWRRAAPPLLICRSERCRTGHSGHLDHSLRAGDGVWEARSLLFVSSLLFVIEWKLASAIWCYLIDWFCGCFLV